MKDWPWLTIGLALCFCGIVGAVVVYSISRSEIKDGCHSKGGIPLCPYKSSCVCLAKGAVIP